MISGGGRSAIAVIPSVGSGRYAPGPSIALPSLFECWSPNDTIQYRLLEGHHKTRQRCYRVDYRDYFRGGKYEANHRWFGVALARVANKSARSGATVFGGLSGVRQWRQARPDD